jgi:hypothetical protein
MQKSRIYHAGTALRPNPLIGQAVHRRVNNFFQSGKFRRIAKNPLPEQPPVQRPVIIGKIIAKLGKNPFLFGFQHLIAQFIHIQHRQAARL